MNLPAQIRWISKNLPLDARASGQVFTDLPSLCWQVHHSLGRCTTLFVMNCLVYIAAAAALALASKPTHQVDNVLLRC